MLANLTPRCRVSASAARACLHYPLWPTAVAAAVVADHATGVGGSFPSALNELANGTGSIIQARSTAKLENLAALEMPFELKALEVCLDSVSVRVRVRERDASERR